MEFISYQSVEALNLSSYRPVNFYETRTSLPPIPSPVCYEEVASQLLEDRCDFIAHPTWAFNHNAGTYYLSDKSKLAKTLVLPVRLVAYENLSSGKVVLATSTLDSKDVQSLAIIDAPEFSAYDGARSVESYLMKEMWPRRLVWSALLKSEDDAWADLLSSQEQAAVAAPMMMAMGMPETVTDFRLIQGGTNRLDLSVYLPKEFVGATVDLERNTNLVEGAWSSVLETNVATSGLMSVGTADIPALIYQTNVTSGWVDCPSCSTDPTAVCTNQTLVVSTNWTAVGGGLIYYKTTASSTNDTDSDGLDNVSEYDAGTDYLNKDSDGDLMLDGYEVDSGLNPLGTTGVDGALGDVDQNGYLNLEEMNHEGAAQLPSNAVLSVRYYYDEENRLREVYQHVQ